MKVSRPICRFDESTAFRLDEWLGEPTSAARPVNILALNPGGNSLKTELVQCRPQQKQVVRRIADHGLIEIAYLEVDVVFDIGDRPEVLGMAVTSFA